MCIQLQFSILLSRSELASYFCVQPYSSAHADAGEAGASARSVTSEELQTTAIGGAFVTSMTCSRWNYYIPQAHSAAIPQCSALNYSSDGISTADTIKLSDLNKNV